MVRYFVTGGSGFIGSHVVARLVELNATVMNYDYRPPLVEEQAPYWFRGDILDEAKVREAIEAFSPDIIIHLAARAEISSKRWDDFASIHKGTSNLINAIERFGQASRLVNVSTQLVIGPGAATDDLKAYSPYTTYGEAKAFAEQELAKRDPAITWLTIRPTNIWGPRHPSFPDTIWKYLAARKYLHPITPSPVFRCYGYVANAVSQILDLAAAPREAVHREIFYLADGVLDSSLWLDQFSVALSGRPARRVPIGLLRFLGRCGDVCSKLGLPAPIDSGRFMRMTTDYIVPLENLHKVTSAPKVSLAEGVAATVDWLQGRS